MGGIPFAEALAGGIVSKLTEYYLVAPIGRQLGYLFRYNTNIEKMKSRAQELDLEIGTVQQQITTAERKCEVIEGHVRKWIQDANEKKEEVNAILEGQKEVGEGCWNEWCLNLKSRYWLSRKATKKPRDLVELANKRSSFTSISHPPPPPGIVSSSEREPKWGSCVEFESRFSIMRDVMKALKDDTINMIGIWGMAGVGKTTMVEEVENKAREEHMFDEVVWVVVTQEPNLKGIQGSIAEFLGLDLGGEDLIVRARKLRERLTKGDKRRLIILDDVWKILDLDDVGIPCGDDFKGCKIVLTSREKDVCDQMRTDTDFNLEVLHNEEASQLFETNVGHSSFNFDWHSIAKDIVKECGGLPLAITTIARALERKTEATWRDVLRQLQNSALEGKYAKVYEALRVSYNFLETKEIKKFFLLCCLFPEDFNIPIEQLVRYGVGRRLFEKTNDLQEARTQAYAHVEKLQNSNLLLVSDEGHVKMHDLVRDFAIWITSSGQHVFMVKFGTRLEEWPRPKKDSYSGYTSISLQCDGMRELPNLLRCPDLKLLRLVEVDRYEVRSLEFPEGFYEGMDNIQVIALDSMSVQSLPQSLKLLTNLRTLSLDFCQLLKGDVSMIGNLQSLEILSFARSDIEQLPKEIGKLTRLRLLDLTWCRKLRTIAPGVLPNLKCLEELYMRDNSVIWAEAYASPSMDESRASFDDVKKLAKLLAVDIDIPYEVLPIALIFENLKKFKISTAGSGTMGALKNTLVLKADKSVLVEGLIKALCYKTENLCLEVKDLKNLPEELERVGFSKLRSLELFSCDELVFIVNTTNQDAANVFPDLDTLSLRNLGNLEVICRGQHSKQSFSVPSSSMNQPASFCKLREIKLYRCNKLKSIFSLSIARNLINLEALDIFGCGMMEAIFSEEGGDQNENAVGRIVFPHLKRLKLNSLPNLVAFCKGLVDVGLPQLEELDLRWLTKLTTLFPGRETLVAEHQHCLFKHKVTLDSVAAVAEIQPAQDPGDSISKLRRMSVDKCERLLYVFPCNIIQQLQNLESLKLSKCSSLDVVFNLQGSNIEEGREVKIFPQLKEVSLTRLPKLKHLWRGGGDDVAEIELRNLEKLHLEDLPNLVDFCNSIIDEVKLPQLQYLKLQGVPKFTGVYTETQSSGSEHHHASPEHTFFKPTVTLTNVIKRLQNLRDLQVDLCDSVEVVFNLQDLNVNGGCELVALTQLTSVSLHKLSKLTHVWEGCPHIIQGFQNLTSLIVVDCDSLRHLFTPSIAKILVKVEVISIARCKLLEAIVAKEERGDEEEEEECTTEEGILFPQLTKLDLRELPNLLTLVPKAYTLKWSSMKKLTMSDCGNELSKDDKGQMVHNLNDNRERGTTTLTSQVIQQLQNLDYLELEKLTLVEVVFDLQGLNITEGRELVALTQLRKVVLRNLPKLTHVWKQGPHIIQGVQNMKILVLYECASLRHLFTSSMAKILVGLEELYISDCKLLEAIVAEEEGILFPKLTHLFLDGLPNLLTIMPHNFNWSSLENLFIKECGKGAEALNDILHEGDQQVTLSNMGTLQVSKMDNTLFSRNVIPRLHNLKHVAVKNCSSLEVVFDFQGFDVNEGRELAALSHIWLNGLPKLANIWKNVPHNIQGFQELYFLEVKGCDNLRYLFTPSMSKSLVRLYSLNINDCELLEAIVAEEEGGEEKDEYCATTSTILFPKLTSISLDGLPNLMTIIPKAYTFDWPCLRTVKVKGCGKGADALNEIIRKHERVKLATGSDEESSSKTEWPELVGLPAEEAERKIEEDMLGVDTLVLPQDDFGPDYYSSNRVRIFVDSSRKVVRPPWIG